MDRITKIDAATLRLITARINETLAPLAAELGISIRTAKGRYTNGATGSLQLELGTIAADGTVATKEAAAFKSLAKLYNLEADDLGREFKVGPHTYRIVGLNPRAHTMPVLGSRDGRRYKFPVSTVRVALGRPSLNVDRFTNLPGPSTAQA